MKDDEIRALVKAHTDYRSDDFGVDNMCGWCGAHMLAKDARHRAGCGLVEMRRAIVTLGKEALARGEKMPAAKPPTEWDRLVGRTYRAGQAVDNAPKPGEAECCAGCQYPRLCEGCALLRDATDGRR